MYRIAIGGIQHETNTFAPSRATYADFEVADGWPPLCRGAEMPSVIRDYAIPAAGALEEAEKWGMEPVPLLWCSAQPSGFVTTEAFERIVGMLVTDLKAQMPLDGVYLDLHGAMAVEDFPDGDGEILARVREAVGGDVPIVASLDLHGNVSERMVHMADFLTAYRTYPHVDMKESGARAIRRLLGMLTKGEAPAKTFRPLPFLIPITAQCTLAEPAKRLYGRLSELEGAGHAALSLLMGFPPADVYECGPVILAYEVADGMAGDLADTLYAEVCAAEQAFRAPILTPEEAIRAARAHEDGRPVIIADTQDNPGAGGSSDTTGMLRALLAEGATDAYVAAVCDPDSAATAHAAGIGATVRLAIGGKSGLEGDAPLEAEVVVEALGDGDFIATGPMYGGNRMQLGPMALVRIVEARGQESEPAMSARSGAPCEGSRRVAGADVRVILASRKQQAATRAMFHHLGVQPETARILVLKSSVHFRADFSDIAGTIMVAAAPGLNIADPGRFAYRFLRDGVRR